MITPGRRRRTALPESALHTLLRRLAERGADHCLEYGEHLVASSDTALPWMSHAERSTLPAGPDSAELVGVVKCSVARAADAFAAAEGLPGITVLAHASGDADVLATGVDKAVGVAAVRRPGEAVVAFGNDRNDHAMLSGADRSVVVGPLLADLDALPHVRRVPAVPEAVATALRSAVRQASAPPVEQWRAG